MGAGRALLLALAESTRYPQPVTQSKFHQVKLTLMAIQESSESSPIEGKKRQPLFHGWWVLAANSFVMGFSSGVTNYGATVFFNPVSSALGLSRTVTSIAIAMARAENTVLAPLIGYFIDRFGPRGPIFVGMSMMGLGLIMFGLFANNLLLFIITWTFMVSLGANIGGFAPNWATINNWFVRKKGRAMGIGMASQAMGGVILAPLLAFIISRWGWETGAIVTGIAIFLLVLPVARIIRTRPQEMGLLPDGDQPEQILTQATLVGEDASQNASQPKAVTPSGNFSIGQARRTTAFWVLMAALGLRQMGQAGIVLHLSPMLQERYSFGEVQAGTFVGVMAFMGVIGAIAAGLLSDRFSRRKVMGTIVAIEATSLFLLVLGNTGLVYVFIVMYGVGQGAHALNRAILGEYFGNSHYARLWGLLSMATTPLAAAGPIYAGWLSESSGYGKVLFTFMFLYGISSILYWNCRRPSLPVTPYQDDAAISEQPNAG